jgi:hypothetical protein
LERLTAVFVLVALVALVASPGAAGAAPAPTPTPLKTISRIRSSPLCTGLRRAIAPAVSKVLQSDQIIAKSKPLFDDYVRATTDNLSSGARDMAVERLNQLIGPLVTNTERVDELLNNGSSFPRVAHSSDDRQLLKMRAQLQAVNDQQKHALDVISGFVATEQMGELQAAGHEMDKVVGPDQTKQMATPAPANPAPATPAILNAGVGNNSSDPTRALDPRYKTTGSTLGYNPLNAFSQAIVSYQQQISKREDVAAKSVIEAVPLCGGNVPAQEAPSPSPALTPAPSPTP